MSDAHQGAVLVTGGSGFVGLHIVAWLANDGRRVVALHRSPLDAVAERVNQQFGDRITFVQGDVRDRDTLQRTIETHQVTDAVHAAALTNPAVEDTATMLAVNLGAAQSLLDLAVSHSLHRLIVVSSAGVFRSPESKTPLKEDHPVTMGHPYAIFKVAAERLVGYYRSEHGVDATSIRLGPVYGPYERPTESRTFMSPIYEIVAMARRGEPIVAIGPEIGRDWTHADDVALGVSLLLHHDGPVSDLYHLGIGRNYTLRETLQTVATLVAETRIEWTEDPAVANLNVGLSNRRAALGIARAHHDLGYQPRFDLRLGLENYLTYLNTNGA
jgi:nucleoside-diphosphate-sugar epimerase